MTKLQAQPYMTDQQNDNAATDHSFNDWWFLMELWLELIMLPTYLNTTIKSIHSCAVHNAYAGSLECIDIIYARMLAWTENWLMNAAALCMVNCTIISLGRLYNREACMKLIRSKHQFSLGIVNTGNNTCIYTWTTYWDWRELLVKILRRTLTQLLSRTSTTSCINVNNFYSQANGAHVVAWLVYLGGAEVKKLIKMCILLLYNLS